MAKHDKYAFSVNCGQDPLVNGTPFANDILKERVFFYIGNIERYLGF